MTGLLMQVYCNNCGESFLVSPMQGHSGCCSTECRRELRLKEACLILGKRYCKHYYRIVDGVLQCDDCGKLFEKEVNKDLYYAELNE